MKNAILILLLILSCCLFAQDRESELITVVEEMPQFPGGEKKLLQYLYQNIRYPIEALDNGIQGLVVVEFVVNEDGSLTAFKVLKEIGGGCGDEIIRVLRTMPKWKPGKQRGKPIKVYYKLPVRYNIDRKTQKNIKKERKRKMKAEKRAAKKKNK